MVRVTVVRTSWMVRTCLRNEGPDWVLVGVLGSPYKSEIKLEDKSKKLHPYLIFNNTGFLRSYDNVQDCFFFPFVMPNIFTKNHYNHLVKTFTFPDRLCGPDRSKLVC